MFRNGVEEVITNKALLKDFLAKDKFALGMSRKWPRIIGDEIWRFEIYLRKHEYYLNTKSNRLALKYYAVRHHLLGIRLGFDIPCNVFEAGLRINHYGYLVVSHKAHVGEFCDIHQGVNIGEDIDQMAPTIGNNVWIGPGAKIFGGISIPSNVMIGANAVVDHSFEDEGSRIAGVPARKISADGNIYYRNYSS